MRFILLATLSLAACTTETNNASEATVVAAPVEQLVTARLAIQSCRPDLHLATLEETRGWLGDCVPTSIGWVCHPSDDQLLTNLGSVTSVWTATPCTGAHGEPGVFSADLYAGEITCAVDGSTQAHPLCAP